METEDSPATQPRLRSEDVEDVERASVAVSRRLNEDFERNLREPVLATRLHLQGVEFFADTTWELNASMNVLLGRNGYGKSLVLRTLAGMLQRDPKVTERLFSHTDGDARIEVELARNGKAEKLERDSDVFLRDSAGKVPLLAIPDSRFVDRGATTIAAVGTIDFATDGAIHFLSQEPYQEVVKALLAGLVIDYFEDGRSFAAPSFELIRSVMTELTEGQGFRFASIERVGLAGSRIMVETEGLNRPVPIQQASQGTLSMVTIFGLIHRFLQQLAASGGKSSESDVLSQRAIVMIDEVDAHVHPVWQQRIRNLLRATFPNVQFLLSAHSPLIVAGCGPGEVSVLGKNTSSGSEGGFYVDQLGEDFVGKSTTEIYGRIFHVEDLDQTFLRYVNKEARGEAVRNEHEIEELYEKRKDGKLGEADDRQLSRLMLEQGRFDRVKDIQEQRRDKDRLLAERDATIRRLEAELARSESGTLKEQPS